MTAKGDAAVATLVAAAELCERVSARSESKLRVAATPERLLARFDDALRDLRGQAEAASPSDALKLLRLLSELQFLRQSFENEMRPGRVK